MLLVCAFIRLLLCTLKVCMLGHRVPMDRNFPSTEVLWRCDVPRDAHHPGMGAPIQKTLPTRILMAQTILKFFCQISFSGGAEVGAMEQSIITGVDGLWQRRDEVCLG